MCSMKRITRNYIDRPVRDWHEVVAEYNRRNPDDKIKTTRVGRNCGASAMRKLRKALAREGDKLCG